MRNLCVALLLVLFSFGCEFKGSVRKREEEKYWDVNCLHRYDGKMIRYRVLKGMSYPWKESSGLWRFEVSVGDVRKEIISSLCFMEREV